ncbi:hypothetical protein VTI28DRAFT_6482 [Corynascus sepedonium]
MLGSASTLFLLGGLLDVVAARVTPRRPLQARDGPSPSLPYDPNTTEYCSWWVDLTSAVSCPTLLSENFISLDEFRRWNPSITEGCGNLIVGNAYCVEAIGEPAPSPPATSSSTTTTSSTSTSAVTITSSTTKGVTLTTTTITTPPSTTTSLPGGIETPLPTQPSMVSNCDDFYLVKAGDTCDDIAHSNGITLDEFLEWNPEAGASCTGLWADTYACVSVTGHTPFEPPPASTTTTPGNGIPTPTPIQPEMVDDCDNFYQVKSGDTCESIAKDSGVSVAELTTWNPSVGKGCTSLWLDYYICISVVGHEPTPTDPGNGIATPTPTQTGMTKNCNKFHYVETTDNCQTIVAKYKITLANFVKWNPAVGGTACTGLWAKTYACVGVL